jgi:hypothetical protein
MRFPLFPSLRTGGSQRCERCGLRFPTSKEQCNHCSELSDTEVESLRRRVEREHAGHAELGRVFLILAAVVMALVMLLVLR